MICCDTHLHSAFSSDSEAPMEDMIKEGIRLGLKTICFTEHFDPDYPDNPEGLDFLPDFKNYKETLFTLKEKYAPEIEVLYGLEIGVQPHLGSTLSDFYRQYGQDFDFIINSCHIVKGMDPYDGVYFNEMTPHEGIETYFETILSNLKVFPDYQAAGHLDYVCRYLPENSPLFVYGDFREILDAILNEIISAGKGLEVNTAGLKYGMDWPNPHISILKRYRELGGEIITIGSDGHKPKHMAWEFQKLPGILKKAGFSHYAIFRKKKPVFYKL